MKRFLIIVLTSTLSWDAQTLEAFAANQQAQQDAAEQAIAAEVAFQRDNRAYLLWDELLQEYVTREGRVDYTGLKSDPKFNTAVEAFQAMPVPTEGRNVQMAYWINAYNLFTVKLITDNHPLNSITDLKEPWDRKWIKLQGKTYSLNQIEHEILRPTFQDPRVHFAVNCASFSCPKLYNRAFFPTTLDKVLDQLTKDFVGDAKRNSISADRLEISEIFNWYGDDFKQNGQTIIGFINQYSSVRVNPATEVRFKSYDWSLNGK